jgi:hypothetical protein
MRNVSLPFSAFRSTDYGYTRMQVFNSSHLYLEQVSDDKVFISELKLIYDFYQLKKFKIGWKNN